MYLLQPSSYVHYETILSYKLENQHIYWVIKVMLFLGYDSLYKVLLRYLYSLVLNGLRKCLPDFTPGHCFVIECISFWDCFTSDWHSSECIYNIALVKQTSMLKLDPEEANFLSQPLEYICHSPHYRCSVVMLRHISHKSLSSALTFFLFFASS